MNLTLHPFQGNMSTISRLHFSSQEPNKPKQPDAVKTPVIGKGQVLPPSRVAIETGVLSLRRKEESTANLKRDIWMVEDTKTGQKYSLFLDGPEEDLVSLYAEMAKWGEGCKVKTAGTAAKPVPAQKYPFLMITYIAKAG